MADIIALLSVLDVMLLDPATCCLALSSSPVLLKQPRSHSDNFVQRSQEMIIIWASHGLEMFFFFNFSAFSRSDVSAFSRVVSSCAAGLFGMVYFFLLCLSAVAIRRLKRECFRNWLTWFLMGFSHEMICNNAECICFFNDKWYDAMIWQYYSSRIVVFSHTSWPNRAISSGFPENSEMNDLYSA